MICDQRLVDMDDDKRVAIVEQPDGSMLDTPVRVARNGGAGPVRLMPKVRNPHLLPIEQENSRSSDGLLPSMCGRTNGSSSADTGPAFVLALTKKTFPLTSTSVLAI